MNKKTKKALWAIVAICILVVIISYFLGWRIDSKFHILKPSTITLNISEADAEIIVNGRVAKNTYPKKERYRLGGLGAGTYEIVVNKNNFWLWLKKLELNSNDDLKFDVFILNKNSFGQFVTANDPEYAKINSFFVKQELPSRTRPRISADQNFALYADNNKAHLMWRGQPKDIPYYFCQETCQAELEIATPAVTIKNIDYYKGKNHLIIIAAGKSVFVAEANSIGGQNLQPLYIGTNPFFHIDGENLYVRDGKDLMHVKI